MGPGAQLGYGSEGTDHSKSGMISEENVLVHERASKVLLAKIQLYSPVHRHLRVIGLVAHLNLHNTKS